MGYKQATVHLRDGSLVVQADEGGCIDWTSPGIALESVDPATVGRYVLEALERLNIGVQDAQSGVREARESTGHAACVAQRRDGGSRRGRAADRCDRDDAPRPSPPPGDQRIAFTQIGDVIVEVYADGDAVLCHPDGDEYVQVPERARRLVAAVLLEPIP